MADVTIHVRQLLAAIRDDATSQTLTPDDRERLVVIETACVHRIDDPPDVKRAVQRDVAGLLREYYGDLDRANRTPRAFLYLHVGMLSGMIADGDEP